MTCKDCIGYDFCSDYEKYSEADIREFIDEGDVRDLCSYFKNKADFVEVVRCRKCKHHHWEQEPCHGKTEHFCSRLNTQVFADFHCGYGERRDT